MNLHLTVDLEPQTRVLPSTNKAIENDPFSSLVYLFKLVNFHSQVLFYQRVYDVTGDCEKIDVACLVGRVPADFLIP